MQVLRYVLAFLGMLAVLAIALLGGYFIMGPLMQGAGPGATPAEGETQVAVSSAEALPTRAPSNTPLSAGDVLPTRVPSHTPLPLGSELPTRAPTAGLQATEEPAPPSLPPSTATLEPLPEPTWTQTPDLAVTAGETVAVPAPEASATVAVAAPVSVAVVPASLTIREPEGSGTFVITLGSEPEEAVTISLSVTGDECSVTPGEVTLDGSNWSTGANVAVAVVDDTLVDGDQVCLVETGAARSSGADYAEMSVEDVTVTVEDDDAAGISVAPVSLTAGEPDGSATFVVTLSSEPDGAVTIPLSVEGDECSVAQGEVTLDSANWSTGVSVAVAVVDDDLLDGAQVCVVRFGAASSSGEDYAGMTAGDVTLTVQDDDTAGIVITPASLTVREPEGSDTFVVTLSSEPETAVGIPLSPASDECSVTPGEVTLDKANWRTGVSVAVAAQDDDVQDGDQECVIGFGPITSGGADYADVAVQNLIVTVVDDDAAGIVATPANLTVEEPGASEEFVIALSTEPEAAVSIGLSVTSDECSVMPGEVTLDLANWREGVSVAVAPVDDEEEDGDQDCVVAIAAARSVGADYDGLTVEDVVVKVVDDDVAGIVVVPASLDMGEPEGSGSFAVSLSSKPADAVVVSLSADEQVVVTPSSLTFTPQDWNVPQSIDVTVVDDNVVEGRHSSRINQEVSSGDEKYDGAAVDSLTINIADNEAAGVIVTPNEVAVGEGERPETYVVVLASQPSRAVDVTISTDGQTAVDPERLTFRRADWNTPQVVAVTAVDDDVSEGPHVSIISHVVSSDDENYSGVPVDDVTARVADSGATSVAVVVTQSVPGGSTSGESPVLAPIGDIRISPALILVVLLAVVASLVELRSSRRRKDRG